MTDDTMTTWHGRRQGKPAAAGSALRLLSASALLAAALSLTGGGEAEAKDKACPDGEPRLPVTKMCHPKALKSLNAAGGYNQPSEGCAWVVQETPFADGALLYRALRCGKETAKLAFAGGAQMAELSIEHSALGDTIGKVLVQVASADPASPTANVQAITRGAMDNPAEAAKCSVRSAGIDVWPSDALVVDISAAEAAKITEDGPRTACGPYGLDEDSAKYWRVFQGFSWFFDLGQDALEFDPGSFTLMTKDANGKWVQAE